MIHSLIFLFIFFFSEITFSKKYFKNAVREVIILGQELDLRFVSPDLGPKWCK